MNVHDLLSRRQLIMAGSLGAAAWLVPGVFAEELARTPSMTEGPFYPDRLPLDTEEKVCQGSKGAALAGFVSAKDDVQLGVATE